MSTMREIPWGECLLPRGSDAELVREFKKTTGGRPAGGLLYFLDVAWVARDFAMLSARLTRRVYIDHDLADLIGLVVSQDNSCRYCFAVQRAMMRVLGFSERRIEQLEHGLLLAELDPPTRAALAYARRISRSNPLPNVTDADPLRAAGFSEDAIREIAATTAIHTIFNRTSTIIALPPYAMEGLPDAWWMRLVRPLIRPAVKRYLKRDEPEPLREQDREGPFSFVVLALDGQPVAHDLRVTLDDLWASPILTRRCKALLFGVVARALTCPASETEAVSIATSEGLPAASVDRILDHLDVEGLRPQEAALVPFARETVWYDAPRLQQLSRELQSKLTREEFLEAVAALSIANAVCRLGASLLRPASPPPG